MSHWVSSIVLYVLVLNVGFFSTTLRWCVVNGVFSWHCVQDKEQRKRLYWGPWACLSVCSSLYWCFWSVWHRSIERKWFIFVNQGDRKIASIVTFSICSIFLLLKAEQGELASQNPRDSSNWLHPSSGENTARWKQVYKQRAKNAGLGLWHHRQPAGSSAPLPGVYVCKIT